MSEPMTFAEFMRTAWVAIAVLVVFVAGLWVAHGLYLFRDWWNSR